MGLRGTLAVIAIGLLATSSALAQQTPPAATATQTYKQAKELARAGEYEQSLAAIESGLEQAPQDLKLLQLKGSLLLEIRRYEEALAAYQAYLEAGPRGANKRKARKIVRDLGVVETTRLKIEVANGPATIYLDSRTLGAVCVADPVCERGMVPGRYRVYIEREGFAPIRGPVEVTLAQTTELTRTLEELPSKVSLSIQPTDATVTIDGEPVTPGDDLEVPAGRHDVVVAADGFRAETFSLEAAKGEPVERAVTLAAVVPVAVTPDGAALQLNGQPVTLEDGLLALPPGETTYTLTASLDGYESQTVEITEERPEGGFQIALEEVPEPEPEPAPVASVAPAPEGMSSQRKWAVRLTAAGGVAALGVSGLFGLAAKNDWDAARDGGCNDDLVCDAQGLELIDDAQSNALAANIALGAGLALGATAVVLWMTAPDGDPTETPAGVTVAPALGADSIGFAIAGGF